MQVPYGEDNPSGWPLSVSDVREDMCNFVKDGVALLDQEKPNWARNINLQDLDMASGYECVLGQVYAPEIDGSYESGWSHGVQMLMGQSSYMADDYKYGFNIPGEESDYEYATTPVWETLQEQWVPHIEQRQQAYVRQHGIKWMDHKV